MRLLDTTTGQFVELTQWWKIQYAILSHTWDPDGEQTLQELRALQMAYDPSASDAPAAGTLWRDPKMSAKVRRACEVARAHGYRYIWIDSCCIDSTSSAELSEAINSMYHWYRDAKVCYGFLADVPAADDPGHERSSFRESRWFTRGWTLQELIAPRVVMFLSREWLTLGTRTTLAKVVEDVTGIPCEVLTHKASLDTLSVAKRMSWASKRTTTRIEDQAYSLLGIFDLNMPILYGEGDRAFRRLQEEILKRIPDRSLFAWSYNEPYSGPFSLRGTTGSPQTGSPSRLKFYPRAWTPSLFAPSPSHFEHSRAVSSLRHHTLLSEYPPSPFGVRTEFLGVPVSLCFSPGTVHSMYGTDLERCYLVILPCTMEMHPRHILARVCWFSPSPHNGVEHLLPGYANVAPSASYNQRYADLFVLSDIDAPHILRFARMRTVYIPHPSRSSPDRSSPGMLEEDFSLKLSPWSSDVLERQGYTVTRLDPDLGKASCTYHLILSKRGVSINVLIQYDRSFWSELCSWGLLSGAAWISHIIKNREGQTSSDLCRHPYQTFEYDNGSGASFASGFPEVGLEGALGERFTLFLSLDSSQSSGVSSCIGVEVVEPESLTRTNCKNGEEITWKSCCPRPIEPRRSEGETSQSMVDDIELALNEEDSHWRAHGTDSQGPAAILRQHLERNLRPAPYALLWFPILF
ncbi:heterokaryon incompatibility protein-domain-containing protein [Dichomitus squalens]|uniref:Heterokaryon incompatibility protein-domain-containing protein n=1 Tax=Dichomitus squalens TaxID=114155 RepID=A0A4Q9MBD0_9APHY|nr:heterokaryon incompatibility protein-domain-containing protein [Dichomitus squalens]